MSDCSSDPTAGCENSAIVAAVSSCCNSQSTILSSIDTKLSTINTAITNCCTTIGAKQDTMISLLTIIANK